MEFGHKSVEGAVGFDARFYARKGRKAERAGHETELKVGSILLGIEGVSYVYKTITKGVADMKGVDLIIIFDNTSPYFPLDTVNVQVKSSKLGTKLHRRLIESQNGLGEGELDEWLNLNRHIILNGNKEESLVREEFDLKAQAILDYHNGIKNFLAKLF